MWVKVLHKIPLNLLLYEPSIYPRRQGQLTLFLIIQSAMSNESLVKFCLIRIMLYILTDFVIGKGKITPHVTLFTHRTRLEKKPLLCIRAYPDGIVHGANMGPTWAQSAPDGPRVGPMKHAIKKNNCTDNLKKLCYFNTYNLSVGLIWPLLLKGVITQRWQVLKWPWQTFDYSYQYVRGSEGFI